MTWKGVTIMDQRLRFISEYLQGYFSVAELCRQFEISRKTGYKWINRYKKYGAEGLAEKSTQPLSCPHKTPKQIVQTIIKKRQKHPSWGPKKILHTISLKHPKWQLPAISTTADILKKEGLIIPGKRRLRRNQDAQPGSQTLQMTHGQWTIKDSSK